jgi:hypothetical protein
MLRSIYRCGGDGQDSRNLFNGGWWSAWKRVDDRRTDTYSHHQVLVLFPILDKLYDMVYSAL